MLPELHAIIQTLLYAEGRIPADEVEITFERPTREWIDARIRPTINLFLFDLEENTEVRRTDLQRMYNNDRGVKRVPLRRFDLRYLVSALSSVAADEHLLLWRVLHTFLRHPQLPFELLPAEVRALETPISTQVGLPADGPRPLDVWSALEAPVRPALIYTVTAPLDLEIAYESPLTLSHTIRFVRPSSEDDAAGNGIVPGRSVTFATLTGIGGIVRDTRGVPQPDVTVTLEGSAAGSVTDSAGRYTLNKVPTGTITLRLARQDGQTRTVKLAVPSHSYDVEIGD